MGYFITANELLECKMLSINNGRSALYFIVNIFYLHLKQNEKFKRSQYQYFN